MLAIAAWNQVEADRAERRTPVPGAMYVVEGRRMHLVCSGAGWPVIVMEAGLGLSWSSSQEVQPELAKKTRVCSYDRPGLGRSEPRDRPRDAEAVARQMHELLDAAGIRGPLVLMGHSGGGLYVREYAREYPADVAGMVLVDSATPEQFEQLPGFRESFSRFITTHRRQAWWKKMRIVSGLQRLAGRCHEKVPARLASQKNLFDAEACRVAYQGTDLGEYEDFEIASRQAGRLHSLGHVPLLLLSRDPQEARGAESATARSAWDREQEQQKALSGASWRVVARGSGHDLYDGRPELVIAEVTRLMSYLQGGSAPDFGTTLMK